jgi:flagellar hook-associated protein 3 FlgL
MMRITFSSQYRDSSAAVERTSEALVEAQRRVSSGKRIERISDDPTGAAAAVSERNAIAQVDQYTRTADNVNSRLNVVDTVLSDVIEKLTAAQSVATAGRGTTATPTQRTALAQELAGIRDALLDDMNTTLHGRYLFGGAAVTTKPYSATPPATVPSYAGSAAESLADVGNDRSVTIAFNGRAITQGTDTQDLFQTLDALITAVSTGDNAAIGTGLAALGRAFDRATAAQTRVGTDMQVIDGQKVRLLQMKQSGTERLSKLEDVNMAEAITDMQQADAAYKAALGAVGTVSRVSLMDYLK